VDLRVSEPHPYLVERERLALSIEAQCHRGPRAERGEQEIVRSGSAVEPAGLDWLVGKQEMCQSCKPLSSDIARNVVTRTARDAPAAS
jgi:hypothetical protein